VYGVSFFIVLVNTFLFDASFQWKHSHRWPKWETILTLVITGSLLTYGYVALSRDTTREGGSSHLSAAVVQANIDQSLKWDPSYQARTLDAYEKLTRLASTTFHPELIIWPETALPFFFQDQHRFSRRVLALSQETGEVLLFGSPAYAHRDGVTRYYNRAYLLNPGFGAGVDTASVSVSRYDKIHLVPFGEYIPLKGLFPFVHKLVQAAGDFAAGVDPEPLSMNGISLGVLICFEAIFPPLARDLVNKGAVVLINLTNDAWFGKSSAPYQHLSMAVFRSVETRRPMIRAANTGFSAFISPSGKIVSRSDLFSEAVLCGVVATNNKKLTPYTRYGDLFALVLSALSILKTAQIGFNWRKKRKQT
jgi:apolipoprotein N-acyltransferase